MSSTYCIILRKQRKVHTVLFRKCNEKNFKKYKIKKERWMFLTKLNDLRAVGVVGREACARWVCSPVLHPQFPPKNIIQWPTPPNCSIFLHRSTFYKHHIFIMVAKCQIETPGGGHTYRLPASGTQSSVQRWKAQEQDSLAHS